MVFTVVSAMKVSQVNLLNVSVTITQTKYFNFFTYNIVDII